MTAEPRDLWLASTRADGRPHLVPIWFVIDDAGVYWLATGANSVKTRNIARDPRVVFGCAGTGPTGDQGDIVIEGVASVVERAPVEVLDRLEAKYGWRPSDEPDDDIGEVAFIRIVPGRRVMGTDPIVD